MKRKKRLITAEDLYKIKFITDMEMSPNGKYLVFSLHSVNRKNEKKYADICIISIDGGKIRKLTKSKSLDTQPKWTLDGKNIVFISNRDDEKQSQLYSMPHKGGKVRKITNMQGEFLEFDWSPDRKTMVCCFRKKDKNVCLTKDKEKKKLGITCREISRIFYKEDGKGYLPKERWHIWTIDYKTGKAKQLTFGEIHDELEPYFTADGKHILITANSSKKPDLDPDNLDFFLVPVKGGRKKKIDLTVGPKFLPTPSPNGKLLAYYGQEGRGRYWKNMSLWLVPPNRSKKEKNLTEEYDINVSNDTINDISDFEVMSPTWSHDGNRIYFQVSQEGNTHLMSLTMDGKKKLETIIGEKGNIGSFNIDDVHKKIAYFHSDTFCPGDIKVFDMKTKKSKRITKINDHVLKNINLGQVEEVWIKTRGKQKIQGWIIKPPHFDKKKKYPSILEIHGGPTVQYGNCFMHEFFYLVAQGYVVYFCNPRGSLGYGEKHTKAIWNNWGSADYRDLMAFTNYISKKYYIDTKKMGVTGGSYGGFMTNWIITHTNRFQAAVTQRCVSNLISMWSTSDFNWISQYEFGKRPPWENYQHYWRMSPIKYIKKAKTPTLVIHSENDFRCPIEQGEQIFVALKKLGIDTEMVLFPQEFHGLSRQGRTDRRVARLKHILNWFDRYLKGKKKQEICKAYI